MTPERSEVIEFRLNTLERAVGEINNAVKSIDQSMQEIVRLQANHAETRDSLARAFAEIADHEARMRASEKEATSMRQVHVDHVDQEARLRVLEKDAPTMRLVRGWVVTGVAGTVALVGVALLGLVLIGG